ncbi:hypothetical protein [Hydromonas duriensis]|uniref:Uncharacterized protein n=1 Tax=Hydromonas duriensis TaxID=1527608 RepID=A0A4V6PY20_9BURK|nr:hypothetical protein [Hydromonas duriensis]TDR27060.1 hypothetical protein DFR44_1473 [Hydromonas duriensis]
MLLEGFVVVRPVIHLNHETGEWRNATEEEAPTHLAMIDMKDKLRGDYLKADDRYHFCYRTDDGKMFFRADDGTCIEIDGYRYAEVVKMTDSAGNKQPDFSMFTIYEANGEQLYRTVYRSDLYYRLFLAEKSGVALFPEDVELGDWDFFVSCVDSFEYMKEKRLENQPTPHAEMVAAQEEPIKTSRYSGEWVAVGEICQVTGLYEAPYLRNKTVMLYQGQKVAGDTHNELGQIVWYRLTEQAANEYKQSNNM